MQMLSSAQGPMNETIEMVQLKKMNEGTEKEEEERMDGCVDGGW
jgi:hypothetical protein